ncbi:MAG TPA: DOPA 4,5-dioxygenase family protein [Candidatus Binatia bacterium]|jgi:DOPA 4,5-dioxygenase|nr:DOPA 4,5-dioxygenase family protein [Candidatus Binatia bacterium]
MKNDTAEIKGFHAHVYYDPGTREVAARVRDGLAEHFDVELGRWHDKPVGPHPQSMYQVKFSPEEFGKLIPWLMLHHEGLDVLIHPSTGDDVGDHTHRALWLGEKLALNIKFLQQVSAASQEGKPA